MNYQQLMLYADGVSTLIWMDHFCWYSLQIVRKDPRIIQKLHRRVFLHAVNDNSLEVLISFYIDAPTEDAARAHRENFTLTFLDILRRCI